MKQQGTGKSWQVTVHFPDASKSYIQSVCGLYNIFLTLIKLVMCCCIRKSIYTSIKQKYHIRGFES